MASEGDESEWQPSCYDCGREFANLSALVSHPVHIDHEDGGYDRVEVPMCPACRKERMVTHECQNCGQEYLNLSDAAECCQHRLGPMRPDGGKFVTDPGFDADVLADPVCQFCGNPIEAIDKQCPELENGRCLP